MSTQTKKKSSVSPPLPINKVFVSSTFTDMLPYREAIRSAIDRANCKAVGMERFGAASIPSLEKCLEELKTCQIYVCAIGMRYGSIDKESQMSYTQLEFNYAKHIGMPILAFLIDGKKAVFHEGDFDTGDSAERLKEFKEEIKDSSITCDFFATAEELEVKVLQSLNNEISREEAAGSDNSKVKAHIDGAELFSRFIKLPAIYKNQEAVLQVRFDGKFGSYMLTDALPIAFGFQPGTALFLNNLFVLGKEPDVSIKEWYADCFAAHRAADWILDNEVTSGTIFKGRFRLAYEKTSGIARRTENGPEIDAYIANLILLVGIEVVSRNVPISPQSQDAVGPIDNFYEWLSSLKTQ